jgi:parallel beta-helix repeat protein
MRTEDAIWRAIRRKWPILACIMLLCFTLSFMSFFENPIKTNASIGCSDFIEIREAPFQLSADPILIETDELTSWQAVGASGIGTVGNPYILEDMVIEYGGSYGHCIDIRNTVSYFIIQNCILTGASSGSGIHLWNVTNGLLINNTCSSNFQAGIQIGNSTFIEITEGHCSENGIGAEIGFNSGIIWIEQNTISENSLWGLHLDRNSGTTSVSYNIFEDNGDNAWNTEPGTGDSFHHNYWSDYAGVDSNLDGIGDTPYSISGSANSKDHYPLIFPPGRPQISWEIPPSDQFHPFGDSFEYQLQVVAYGGINYFMLNDSVNFQIDSSGLVTNKRVLEIGIYGLEVTVHDLYSNSISASFDVTILDILPPEWINEPIDKYWELGTPFFYDIDATDPSGIGTWSLNGTQFSVSSSGTITNSTFVPVGLYGLNLTVSDTLGNAIFAVFTVYVEDTTSPAWVEMPVDCVIEYDTPFRYDLNASDLSGVHIWWLNDESNFQIDSNGVITNSTFLLFGHDFSLDVSVNDTYGNIQTATITIEVIDSIDPEIIQGPVDSTLECGETLDMQLSAIDNLGISHWTINDTTHFAITSIGRVFSIGIIQPGIYGLEITVHDLAGNTESAVCTVAVEDTHAPTWTQSPYDNTIEYGSDFEYQLYAEDPGGLHDWWVDDDIRFAISDSGLLHCISTLQVGEYYLEVSVSDTEGNVLNHVLKITVEDTTPPEWIVYPLDMQVTELDAVYQELQASDLSGISSWIVNDTVHFNISSSGELANIVHLTPGEYILKVIAQDPYGNNASAFLIITVTATDNTVMVVTAAGIGISGVVILLFLVAHPRGRRLISSIRGGKET